jgi:tyrosyl-tRNA synthetase
MVPSPAMTNSEGSALLSPLLADLDARGLVHQMTSRTQLGEHLATKRRVYCGFDPTRASLTIGNLVSILLLRRFQLAGHQPIVVMGGGTGLIGDPSGKDAERQLLTPDMVRENVAGQRPIFERVLDFAGPQAARIVDNADWIEKLRYVDVLRDIGKHFSVNMMIQKDSVRARLEEREHGISYTEFSYMILQAYDFAHLAHAEDVTLQVGGSDQWGNIALGVDLARRLHGREVFGLTTPLLTKSDGGKFGKTEQGAVWLTADGTSPYAFYQFWINAADEDAPRFLRVFSLRPLSEIEAILAEHDLNPAQRTAQQALAEELTKLLHGDVGLALARRATQALFSGDVKSLEPALLDEVFRGAPTVDLDRGLLAGDGLAVVELLTLGEVAKSRREAKQYLASGAVSLNGERVVEDHRIGPDDLLHGRLVLVRRGKKTWHVCRF